MPESPEIFVSFKSEEIRYAEQMRQVLVEVGYRVWWDRKIEAGTAWRSEIEEKLLSSTAILVLWSKRALHESSWVPHEASVAIGRGIYTPCLIEALDLPEPYSDFQTPSLVGWDGGEHSGFAKVLDRLEDLTKVGRAQAPSMHFAPWPERSTLSTAEDMRLEPREAVEGLLDHIEKRVQPHIGGQDELALSREDGRLILASPSGTLTIAHHAGSDGKHLGSILVMGTAPITSLLQSSQQKSLMHHFRYTKKTTPTWADKDGHSLEVEPLAALIMQFLAPYS